MATEKQKRLQSAAMKTGYTINTLGEGKASRAENNIRQVGGSDLRPDPREGRAHARAWKQPLLLWFLASAQLAQSSRLETRQSCGIDS